MFNIGIAVTYNCVCVLLFDVADVFDLVVDVFYAVFDFDIRCASIPELMFVLLCYVALCVRSRFGFRYP